MASSSISSLMSISGLASGIDTESIIARMLAIERQPRTRLDQKVAVATARQTVFSDFRSRLRSVEAAAQDLRSVALWAPKQTVTSGDATRVAGALVSGASAAVGSYQVEVFQLANYAQRSYAFVSPASAGTITIDGHATAIAAGATIDDLVSAINTDARATVYAAAADRGTLVLTSRATGDSGPGFIALTDTSGALTEQLARARQGKDAIFRIDGVVGFSSSNEVTSAIAGVRLTLRGVTTTGPITVDVTPPVVDTDAVKRKLQAFVDVYNSTVDAIRARLTERVVIDPQTDSDRKAGMLRGDTGLTGILSQMRQAIYTPDGSLPVGMQSLSDLGISTGGASPRSIDRDAVAGKLTLDAAKLSDALARDPSAVKDLLAGPGGVGGWARGFEAVLNPIDRAGGTLDTIISGVGSEVKRLQSSMADMDARLALRERTLRAQFTAMETALARSQSQAGWLQGQLAGLS